MKCRVCQGEIAFVMMDGRQTAVHTQSVGGSEGFDFTNPSPGQQRKLRQKLEEDCRRAQSAAPDGHTAEAERAEAPEAVPEMVDDVKSVQEIADQGKEEFKTFNA